MPPVRFDCHVHSTYSPDGHDPMAAFAARVDAGSASGVGFAEHYDFLPSCGAWEFLDLAGYFAEIAAWRGRGYRFYAGVEVDFVAGQTPAIRAALQARPFDFVIGSVHSLPSGGVSDRNIDHWREAGMFERMLDEYAAEFLASLAVPEFDVIGHPCVFLRYLDDALLALPALTADRKGATVRRERTRELEAALAEAAAGSGKAVEVNTSGLFKPRGETCASPFFLERFRAAGGERITLSSDAHRAADLRRGIPQARPVLEALGFREVWLPWDDSAPVALADYAAEAGA